MTGYGFTLVLSGVSEITPDLSDALYEATGGDIEFNIRDGVAYIERRQYDRQDQRRFAPNSDRPLTNLTEAREPP